MLLKLFKKRKKYRNPYPVMNPKLQKRDQQIVNQIDDWRLKNGKRMKEIVKELSGKYNLRPTTIMMIYYGTRNKN